MSVVKMQKLDELSGFGLMKEQLGVVERNVPQEAEAFFNKLMQQPLLVFSVVSKNNAEKDIRELLEEELSENLQVHPFYDFWVQDMAENAKVFCDTLGEENITFWLGSQRGCRRYHIDNVPMRMLVTYAGKGTEWLPDEAVNREAYEKGQKNDQIIRFPQVCRHMGLWDVAIFKGGPKGILHRTPDDAMNNPSIFMRLDHPDFWDKIIQPQFATERA